MDSLQSQLDSLKAKATVRVVKTEAVAEKPKWDFELMMINQNQVIKVTNEKALNSSAMKNLNG